MCLVFGFPLYDLEFSDSMFRKRDSAIITAEAVSRLDFAHGSRSYNSESLNFTEQIWKCQCIHV